MLHNSINMFKKRENIAEIEEGNLLSPKFDNEGLIPVVTTCSNTKEILNDEGLKKYSEGPSGAMGSDLQIKKRDEIFHYIENLTKNFTTEFLDKKLSEKIDSLNVGVTDKKSNDINNATQKINQLSNLAKEKIFNNIDEWNKMSSIFENYLCSENNNLKNTFSNLLLQCFKEKDIRVFEEKEFDFGCGCSIEKVKQTMSIYSMKEIEVMTNDLGKVTADCQFCGTQYILSPSELVRNI